MFSLKLNGKEITSFDDLSPLELYQRIERLYKTLCKIKEDEKIKNISIYNGETFGFVTFVFMSNYEEVKMTINFKLNTIIHSLEDRSKVVEIEYRFDYGIKSNEYKHNIFKFTCYDNLFKVNSLQYTTSVEPYFTQNSLTAHDIDMAIYEIEEYIKNKYGTLEEIENYNKQQIDILEKGV